jgi:hypothetical protein
VDVVADQNETTGLADAAATTATGVNARNRRDRAVDDRALQLDGAAGPASAAPARAAGPARAAIAAAATTTAATARSIAQVSRPRPAVAAGIAEAGVACRRGPGSATRAGPSGVSGTALAAAGAPYTRRAA